MRADVHQHVWTEPLLDALARRRSPPFLEHSDRLCVVHSAGEHPYAIDPHTERSEKRNELLDSDRLDAAIVAPSSPIGIETLPRDSAQPLIEAHLAGVGALGERFQTWGPLVLDECQRDEVDSLLDRGCIGISLPATALTGPDALHAIAPVLERIEARDAPLFIHPGPPPSNLSWEASPTEPPWWRALTDYVAQMQTAWLTLTALWRRDHPRLVVVFAMLAGGAPLLSERLQARGGPSVALRDRRIFYDTSSYGPAAVEAMASRSGSTSSCMAPTGQSSNRRETSATTSSSRTRRTCSSHTRGAGYEPHRPATEGVRGEPRGLARALATPRQA